MTKSKYDVECAKQDVLRLIPNHPENIYNHTIQSYTGYSARDIRHIVQWLREDGYPICASPTNGYWMAQTPDEISSIIRTMKSDMAGLRHTITLLESTMVNMLLKSSNTRSESNDN